MKKRNLLAAMLASLTMSLRLLAVFGAGSPVIDPERKASLTLCKIRENSAASFDTQGMASPDIANAGMQGVRFGALKIADIEAVAGGGEAGTYFAAADADFLKLLERNGIALESKNISGRAYYTTEAMSEAVKALNAVSGGVPGEVQIAEYVRASGGTRHMPETDAAGRTSLAELPLGLYLVAEESHAAGGQEGGTGAIPEETIHNTSQPFLVSLPMTDQTGGEKAEQWLYDVTVYPKNQTIRIPKYLVSEDDGDTLLLRDDFEIGETVRQVIAPGAPAVTEQSGNRGYEKYEILDTMEKGLSFKALVSVRLGQKIAEPEKLSEFAAFAELREGLDFALLKGGSGETPLNSQNAAGTKAFRVRFLAAGLEKLNAMKYSGQVAVTFDAVVTRGAEDGNAKANRNKPTLTVKTANALAYSIDGNEPEVFSYRLAVKKKGVSDASRVMFRVERGGMPVSFVMEKSGVYHLFDGDLDLAEKQNATEYPSPASDGTLILRGLDADEYEFTEMATESGFELLKSKFTVILTGNAPADGNLKAAELSTGGRSSAITVSGGTASFSVANHRSLILRTGGAGTKVIYAAGIGAAAAAVVLFTVAKMRRKG